VQIRLTKAETLAASVIGIMRNICALFDGRKTKFGTGKDWHIHIEGACGEMAASKALGIHNPQSINNFTGPDLGSAIQVRTRSQDHYDLIVRPGDNPEEVYVLVTGTAPEYTVRGWIKGQDAQQDKWINDHGGHGSAWFVPQSALSPIEQLPETYR
jgi:hypothetical protein